MKISFAANILFSLCLSVVAFGQQAKLEGEVSDEKGKPVPNVRIITAGAEGARLLGEATAAYRRSLGVFTREHFSQQWAMTQHNLGLALMAQGKRTAGAEGKRLLEETLAAYREELTVVTREQSPR